MKQFNRIFLAMVLVIGVSITVPTMAETPQEIDTLTKKAEAGDVETQFDLANAYYEQQDYAKAKWWWKKAAAQGLADAKFNLAVLYEKGLGVPQDYTQARQWYQKAAADGVVEAQYNLGMLYKNGRGIPRNYKKAAQYFRQACDNGSEESCDALEDLQNLK